MLLGMIDGGIVNVALPTLVRTLHSSFAVVEWAVLAFLLGISSLTLTMGRLGDVIGKKRVFVTGLVVFTISSGLCGSAAGIYSLIVFRFVQSVGAAMMTALGVAIITETWPAEKRATALGIAGGILSLGGIAGPAIGGWVLHYSSWRWIFFVNVPIGLASLVLALFCVPPLLPEHCDQKFDFLGSVLASTSMFTFVLALTLLQHFGLNSPVVMGLLACSLVTLAAFLWVETQVQYPMLELTLFRDASFSTSVLTGYLSFVSLAGVVLLFPFYLQTVGHLDERQVGMVLGVSPGLMAIWGPLAGIAADRFGARLLSVFGLAVMAVGYLMMSRLGESSSPLAFICFQIPLGMGIATFSSGNNAALMTAVPRHRLGIANGVLAMSRTAGNFTGVALLGTFFYCRLQAHTGRPVEVISASPVPLVRALHDQFHLAAAIMILGTGVALWQHLRSAGLAAKVASDGLASESQ